MKNLSIAFVNNKYCDMFSYDTNNQGNIVTTIQPQRIIGSKYRGKHINDCSNTEL